LTIPAGQQSGAVVVEAGDVGEGFNLPEGQIKQIAQPLAFLQSVVNTERVNGGTSPESESDWIARAFASLRLKAPISASDYEEFAQNILGVGSRAKAIGLLSGDTLRLEKGSVHVFCLSSSRVPANAAEIAAVRNALTPIIQLGTRLYVSPMQVVPINLSVIAKIEDNQSPDDVADNLWQVFNEVLDPTQYEAGAQLDPDEVAHSLRFAGGVKFLELVELNGDTLPIVLPNEYTLPTPYGAVFELVEPSGQIFTLIRGSGEPAGG
jgi:Baseplate J-like protein